MKFILKKMKNKKDRSAVFICSLSFKDFKRRTTTVIGKIRGSISYKMMGTKGFGYDPIFIPELQSITFGQMSKKDKVKMDHRFFAFKKLKTKIRIL